MRLRNRIGLVTTMRIDGRQPQEEGLVLRSFLKGLDPSFAAARAAAHDGVEVHLRRIAQMPFARGGRVISGLSQQAREHHLLGRQRLMQFHCAGVVRIPTGQ